ncbi:hypothetical protein ACFE04_010592 [Oxalis oulophora]
MISTFKTYQVLVSLVFFFLSFQIFIVQSRNLKTPPKFVDYLNNLIGIQKGHSVTGLRDLKNYLKTFGYYNNLDQDHISLNNDDFDDHLHFAIEEYQKFFNINVTGMLDSDTIKKMTTPRCGGVDIIRGKNNYGTNFNNQTFVSKYSFISEGKWPPSQNTITYRFSTSSEDIDLQTLMSVVANSFQKWAEASDRFTFKGAPIGLGQDVMIGFYAKDHGDGSPFDGFGGVVAHAVIDPDERLIHYDSDEYWSIYPLFDQMDLESVSTHEIGHILGLGHSTDPNAVMHPALPPGAMRRDLSQDDIDGIRTLYSS